MYILQEKDGDMWWDLYKGDREYLISMFFILKNKYKYKLYRIVGVEDV